MIMTIKRDMPPKIQMGVGEEGGGFWSQISVNKKKTK
jgi:hypothetical protein